MDLVPFLVLSDGFEEGYFPGGFLLSPQEHQQLVLYAPAGISGEPPLFFVKCPDGFDQSDAADGDEVLYILVHILILFCDMNHQAQVPLHQDLLRPLRRWGSCGRSLSRGESAGKIRNVLR